MVLGIAPVAIIDRQLPFEYTITSRSTDVVVMAQPVQNINHSAFRSMFEREKLSGNNFNDWFCQLKLVLRVEKKMYVIEQPLPAAPAADSEAQVLSQWNVVYDAYNEVACLILDSMTPELHRQYENSSPYDMIKELKAMFEKQARMEKFDPIQTFHACKQEEGKPVVAYVIQMKGYVDQLERLGYMLPQDLITVGELHAMLIEYEKGLPKKAETLQVMMIKGGKIQKAKKKSLKAKGKGKANGKGNDKQVYIPKPKNPKPSAKEHPAKDDTCHHYKEVYDTGCGTHICITKQGFREARKLKQGALYLYVGNGVRAQVEAIGSYDLVLPNGLVICLDNCHYAPSITRGVVSVHCLAENGFIQRFMDFGILVSKNNVFYFKAIHSNGIYEIDMHDLVPNNNSIYNVSTKRAKHNLDSTYLWHCRLAHINDKEIVSTSSERATDFLRIIHTDVCGLLRHVSRQGVSYFITFTDDYSRYGYVYLLKHKHEDYALESATRILNMVPTKMVDKTPYELWYGKVPNLSYLKVWGCEALVKRDTPDKLQQRFVEYAEFFEKSLITQDASGRAIDLEEIQDEDTSPSEITSEIPMEVEGFEPPQEEVILIRRSERTHRAPNRLCLNVEAEEHSLGDLNEPTSYKAAMLDPESNKWLDAMNAEMQSMIDNMVWVLVDLPPNCKTVGKTFSPVADIRAIRILISIAAFYVYKIWQMDVKTTFLNGYLDEDVYMVQPKGFVDSRYPRKVCKLQRSIYGLKQASRSWNKRFDEKIKKFGFVQNLDEPCVYQKASGSNVTFLVLYVDDIIIMGNHILSLQSVKDYLRKCFAMKYLGAAAFILGIKIYRDRNIKDMFLVYGGNPEAELRVDCYCDAGFDTDRDDIKSQTGYVFVLNGGAMDWKSSKQSTIAMSATEAEYIAASEAAMEAVWIRKFISGL
ncbi:retrotransposon protein, putative, ty1-copia subclass, partial [Tanacetum coccineum]